MSREQAVRWAALGPLGGVAALGYVLVVRPWFLRWGATEAETRETLPGDGLVSYPRHHDTHAITIHAPVAEVWPWLVQIGQDKGGFYSYAWLENLAGCHIHNADRVMVEYQALKAGDPVRLHPSAPPLTAMIVDPCRAIVLGGGAAASPAFDGTWGFMSGKWTVPRASSLGAAGRGSPACSPGSAIAVFWSRPISLWSGRCC